MEESRWPGIKRWNRECRLTMGGWCCFEMDMYLVYLSPLFTFTHLTFTLSNNFPEPPIIQFGFLWLPQLVCAKGSPSFCSLKVVITFSAEVSVWVRRACRDCTRRIFGFISSTTDMRKLKWLTPFKILKILLTESMPSNLICLALSSFLLTSDWLTCQIMIDVING